MTNLTPRDRQDKDTELLRENMAMREQNIAIREQNRAIRENDSTATGLLLGILLLGLAAIGVGVYVFNQKPTVTPTRTIIERDRTTTVPASPLAPPNVNVTVPNPAPPNVNIAVPNSGPNSSTTSQPAPTATSAPSDSSNSNTAPSSGSSNTAPQTAPANP